MLTDMACFLKGNFSHTFPIGIQTEQALITAFYDIFDILVKSNFKHATQPGGCHGGSSAKTCATLLKW